MLQLTDWLATRSSSPLFPEAGMAPALHQPSLPPLLLPALCVFIHPSWLFLISHCSPAHLFCLTATKEAGSHLRSDRLHRHFLLIWLILLLVPPSILVMHCKLVKLNSKHWRSMIWWKKPGFKLWPKRRWRACRKHFPDVSYSLSLEGSASKLEASASKGKPGFGCDLIWSPGFVGFPALMCNTFTL